MHWQEDAFILSTRRFREHDGIVELFARGHGRYAGVVRGACGKRQGGIWQPGNLVAATWRARLAEQLGTVSGELVTAHAAALLSLPQALTALQSAVCLLQTALPEREQHPRLFDSLNLLIDALCTGPTTFLPAYALFEYDLLIESGFRLDLSRCAATGSAEELCYVSPKSGCAVSREAGAPYHARMLPLPAFIRLQGETTPAERTDIPAILAAEAMDALRLTGYFLETRLFQALGKTLPAARGRLFGTLNHKAA